jgi:maltose O-acetyltransferase
MGSGEILIQARSPDSEIVVGQGNVWSNNVSIVANQLISIGEDCQIGDGVAIYDCDFHEIDPRHRNRSPGPAAPVCIGNNVLLGSRAMVLKGVTIGDNSVIAAMSVVTKAVPGNSIAAGNPARVIRTFE